MTTLGSIRAKRAGDGRLWSVQEMLEEALEDYRSGKRKEPKAILILLDDDQAFDGISKYITYFYQAGMKFSDIVGLLAIMQNKFSSGMGI